MDARRVNWNGNTIAINRQGDQCACCWENTWQIGLCHAHIRQVYLCFNITKEDLKTKTLLRQLFCSVCFLQIVGELSPCLPTVNIATTHTTRAVRTDGDKQTTTSLVWHRSLPRRQGDTLGSEVFFSFFLKININLNWIKWKFIEESRTVLTDRIVLPWIIESHTFSTSFYLSNWNVVQIICEMVDCIQAC